MWVWITIENHQSPDGAVLKMYDLVTLLPGRSLFLYSFVPISKQKLKRLHIPYGQRSYMHYME